jgi:uncharacterized protein (TIGR02001 family)
VKRSRKAAPRLVAARTASALIILTALATATSARAGASASVSVASDYRYRGVSLSDQRPVVSLDVAADFANGVYLGASALGVWPAHAGFRALSLQEYAGYARRLGPELTADIGVSNANYTEAYAGGASASDQELYVGLSGHGVTGRVFYAPNYFGHGYPTVYGELSGVMRPRPSWRLSGQLGVLSRTGGGDEGDRVRLDWRFAVAKEIKALTLETAVVGRSGGGDEDREGPHQNTTVVVALSWAF